MKPIKKEEISDLDVILVASETFVGKSIQKFIDAKINHAGVLIWLENKLYVSEAVGSGLQLVSWEEYINSDKGFIILKPNGLSAKFDIDYIKHSILSQTKAHKYDYLSLLVFQPIRHLCRKLFGKSIWLGKKGKYAKKRFFCSEWVAYLYNIYYGKFPSWWLTDPADIQKGTFFTSYLPE